MKVSKQLVINLFALNTYPAQYITYLKRALTLQKLEYNVITMPLKTNHVTLLKSPHVNKKAREQFIFKRYKITLIIKNVIDFQAIPLLFLNKPKNIKATLKIKER
jgi:ribosomal protein S10